MLPDVIAVTLKLLGIFAWYRAFEDLANNFSMFLRLGGENSSSLSGVLPDFAVPFLLYICAGAILVFCSRNLAQILWRQPRVTSAPALTSNDIHTLAFGVAGALTFLIALPVFARDAMYSAMLVAETHDPDGISTFLVHQLPDLISAACQIVLGLLLFFRARSIAAIWSRLQEPKKTNAKQ